MPAKWTLERFLERAREIHGDKFDYSEVTEDHIKGKRSKVPLLCNTCGYRWSPVINDHINSGSGCPSCTGRVKWNLERFLKRAQEIHGDKFDYSAVREEDIKGASSTISITCNQCGYHWSPSITCHINSKSGCLDCAGKLRWTLERFIQRSRKVHGDKFDYSKINEEDIKGHKSKITIVCNSCHYEWSQLVDGHVQGRGCPNCANQARWTLEKFLKRAGEIHNELYDYSKVTEDHIKNARSKIPITCNQCGYHWSPEITSHINCKNKCPSCTGKVKWTLERFFAKANEIHKGCYDYSYVTEKHINGIDSKIPIICKSCGYQWSPSIHNHIYGYGCPDCSGNAKWTLERFLERAKGIHGDKFDYSRVMQGHIENNKSKVPIVCKTCRHTWSPSIGNHINSRSGCPICNLSYGERECQRILEECGLEYQREVILPELPKKRFDFAFCHEDHLYFLEFDGIQHFEDIEFFAKKIPLQERQDIDLLKTKVVLERGATLIRIDYTEIDNIYEHICKAIEEGNNLYFSTPEMYTYITDRLK